MRVRDYMSSVVITLPEDACLLDAALLVRRTGKRHLPVLDAAGGVAGIVTDRDVHRCAPSLLSPITPEEYNAVFEGTPVTLAMTKNPLTVSPDADVAEAVSLLYTKKIGALPVVEDGKLVGIVTVSDMLGLLNELLAARSAGEN